MYMATTYFFSHDADGAISDTIAFLLLRLLFRSLVPVPVLLLASVSYAIDNATGIM